MNKEVKETTNIKVGINENTYLNYYKQLWNIQNFNGTKAEWNSKNKEDSIITSDELGEALKLTKKIERALENKMSTQNHINTHQKNLNRDYSSF
jgi:hypothetical protein